MKSPTPDQEALKKLIELEPRFGKWMTRHIMREDMQTMFWVQGWAAEIFAEALIEGNAAHIESFLPFLGAISEIAKWNESTYFKEPGDKFALHLDQALRHAPRTVEWDPTILPHTLYSALQAHWDTENRHDTYDYGKR
jgi:hypothetical protein